MSFDVFISYAHQDRPIAFAACAIIENAGIRCWIAPRDIAPGAEYATALIEALESCKALVLIFSGSANESPHIRREVERAVSRGVPLIPVRIEDIQPNAALKFFVSSVHWLDALSPPLERHFEHLAGALRAVLDKGEPAGAARADAPPIDNIVSGARARAVFRARCAAGVWLGIGGVLCLLAALTRDTPDLLLGIAVYGLSYLLIFRNIPGDLKTARLLTILLLALGGYFVLLNVMALRKFYIAIDSIEMICGIYLLYQLNAAMKPERAAAR
jgi:hypothetical protein